MYGFAVQAVNKDGTRGNLIYRQPLESAHQVNTLKTQLVEGDSRVERQPYYFPHLQQASKLDTLFQKAMASVKAFFLDLVTLPYRMYTYNSYKAELKNQLPIYQYLKSQHVPQKYLDQDRFEIILYSGEIPATSCFKEGSLLRHMAIKEGLDLSTFYGKNYQELTTHRFDVYEGACLSSGYGLQLLTDEMRATLRNPFVAI